MKTKILFPYLLKWAANGSSGIAVRQSFHLYWNLPQGAVSDRSRAKFVIERDRIMSRTNQRYRLRKEAKSELWTWDRPRTYDLRTAEENRQWQKRNWKAKGEIK